MLIPKKPKRSKQSKRDWFDKKKIKNPVKKELAGKTKALIEKKSKSQVKQIVYSYICPGCLTSFRAENLRSQIVEAARRKDTYISCPKCSVALVVDKLMKVSTKRSSKVNRAADLISVYPNQGINITPSYTPSSWTDRAILERIAHELGKFAASMGMFNPQLKFQRGIRGKVSANTVENVKAAEFTVEAVDDYDLRFRVVAAAGITPAGKVVLPKYFMTLDGREIPFTKEAVAEFLSGKVFGPVDPKPVVPELHYKDRDPVRFREIVASRKKEAYDLSLEKELPNGWRIGAGRTGTPIGCYYSIVVFSPDIDDPGKVIWESKEVDEDNEGAVNAVETQVKEKFDEFVEQYSKKASKKKAAGTPTPGQTVEYQGKNYTIDSITGDAAILTDEAGVQTAPVPNADLNIQFEAGAMPAEISAPTLADRINKLVKRSLRDEKTLVPFTDPDPDYSVAKQTDVDPDFSVPYEKSDQGILSEEERAVQKMFRGGSSIKPVKTAAEAKWEKVVDDFVDYLEEFGVNGFLTNFGGTLDDDSSIDACIKKWADESGFELIDAEIVGLRGSLKEVSKHQIESSIKTASPAEGISPFVYKTLTEAVKEGKSFEETEKVIEEKHPGFDFRKEDYDEAIAKEASIQKTAEPTGYHETDETGKVIELSRLRTLVQDYARAGQLPLDFDLTKVMSEVSRMTRKELLDILDKKQKGQHYPVVHAKREKKIAGLFDEINAGYVSHLKDKDGKTWDVIDVKWLPQEQMFGVFLRSEQGDEQFFDEFDIDRGFEKIAKRKKKAQRLSIDELENLLKGKRFRIIGLDEFGLGDWGMSESEYEELLRHNNQEAIVEGTEVAGTDLEDTYVNVRFDDGYKVRGLSTYHLEGASELETESKKALKRKTIKSKSTNQIVREIRKADLTEEDVKKDIKEEEEGEKHYNQMAKEVDSPKTEKVLKDMADEEAEHAEDLEEVVLPTVKNKENYLEKYDSRKKKAQYFDWSELSEKEIEEKNILIDKVAKDYYRKMKKVWRIDPAFTGFVDEKCVVEAASKVGLSLTDEEVEALLSVASEDETLWKKMRSHPFAVDLSDGSKVSPDDEAFFGRISERLWQDPVPSEEYITPTVVRRTMQDDDYFSDYAYGKQVIQKLVELLREEWRETSQESRLDTEASLRFAQEEEIEEEKPKVEWKELKTKPHGRPAPEEVAEAPAAIPELQTVFNEVKGHQQRLTEIRAIISEARRKTEEEIRKIQEEHGSVAEAAEMQEGIEKLAALIEQSESQIADLGEFFVWLDTEAKTKKFRPTDKWRVEKLIEKFGKDAEEYLTKAERGASSLNTEIEQRLLTVFPKLPKDKESSIQKKADVFDTIAELGSGLWDYVKAISGIISEGEQLELALE